MRIWAAILLSITLTAADASAQSVNRKTDVLGWSGTGQEIVVSAEMQGEAMVDGVAKNFYYEATEMYRADSGQFIRRYKKSEPPGYVHPDYASAGGEQAATKFLETAGLLEAADGSQSPDERWFLHVASTNELDESGGTFRCQLHDKAMLFDTEEEKIFVVYDRIERGEKSSSRLDASCPKSTFEIYWHPGSTDWAMVRVVEHPTATDEWRLLPGRVSELSEYPEAPFQPADHAAELFASKSDDSEVASGRAAIFDGDVERARKTLSKSESTSAERVMLLALSFALEGEKKSAIKTAKTAYSKSPRDAYHEGLLAAVYAATDDSKRTTKHISSTIRRAANYDVLARVGALFTVVDLSVANQVLIHALSHESAEEIDTTDGYVVLMHSLMDARQFKATKDLLERFGEDKDTDVELAKARLAVEEKRFDDAKVIARRVVYAEPGRCLAYRILARAIAPERPADSLGHFRAAVACDPTEIESLFLLGGLELEAGRLDRAKELFEEYLARAYPRRADELRDAKRDYARDMIARISRDGAVLTQATCRPLAGARLCRGTVFNRTNGLLEGITAEVWDASRKAKKKPAGSIDVESIPAGESRTFGIRVEGSGELLDVSAGRNADEHKENRMRAR